MKSLFHLLVSLFICPPAFASDILVPTNISAEIFMYRGTQYFHIMNEHSPRGKSFAEAEVGSVGAQPQDMSMYFLAPKAFRSLRMTFRCVSQDKSVCDKFEIAYYKKDLDPETPFLLCELNSYQDQGLFWLTETAECLPNVPIVTSNDNKL